MSEKKNIILDAAENLFARHGYDGTTTRMIAESAGVNIAMLSYYFGSKENLLKAIMDRFAQDILNLIDQIEKQEYDPVLRLKRWSESYIDYVFAHYKPLIIAHRELGLFNDRPDMISHTNEAVYKIRGHVLETIEKGIKDGLFNAIDPKLTLVTMGATIESIFVNPRLVAESDVEAMNPESIHTEEFKKRVKTHMNSLVDNFIRI